MPPALTSLHPWRLLRSLTFRSAAVISLLFCAAVFAAVFYLQFVVGLEPCPLCVMQRLPLLLIGLLSAGIAALPASALQWQRASAAICILAGIVGLGLAGRHMWIQSLPAELVPACGPDLGEMFAILPLGEALLLALAGDGNCAEVQWSFLGLSIPALAALAFGGLILGWGWVLAMSLLPQKFVMSLLPQKL